MSEVSEQVYQDHINRVMADEGQMPDPIGYCGLFLDEVWAENCVECQHWEFCEYVLATVIPDLLERMLDWRMHGYTENPISPDLIRNVIARLKGEHYVEANDEVPL